MAQPPDVAEVVQVWSDSGVKYICEAPTSDAELSMMMPLVPPVTVAVAAVLVDVLHVEVLVMSNDMIQPDAARQLMGPTATALSATLRNIRSVVPFKNSVIGEQATLAVVNKGPTTGVPMTPPAIGIFHSALTVPLVPQAYRFPVPPEE